jgi:hypothetical protein
VEKAAMAGTQAAFLAEHRRLALGAAALGLALALGYSAA